MLQYCAHFHVTNAEAVSAGGTVLNKLAGTSIETDQTQKQNTRPFFQPGTLSNLSVNVSESTLSSSATWRTALGTTGSTDGNLLVTFGNSETGTKSDTSNTDDVATDDLYSFRIDAAAGSGSITWKWCDFLWESDSGSITLCGANSASATGIGDGSSDQYIPVNGFRLNQTTEAFTPNINSMPGTWRYLTAGQSGSVATEITFTITSRINGADGNQTVTLDETVTQDHVSDTSNTDTVDAGDRLNWVMRIVSLTGPGGTDLEWIASQIEATGDADYTQLMLGGNRVFIDNGTTLYFPLAGQTSSSATEADAQHGIKMDATSSHLAVLTSQNFGTVTGVLRINGADGNQVVVAAGSPNDVVDTSNTDDLTDTDVIALGATASVNSIRLQSASLRLTEVAAAGPHILTPTAILMMGI